MISCSKKEVEQEVAKGYDYRLKLPYDTTAMDSFAPGANPGNVVMKRVVVDSADLAKVAEQKAIAMKKKEEADQKLAEENKKKEEAKKSEEATKNKKSEQEAAKAAAEQPENPPTN